MEKYVIPMQSLIDAYRLLEKITLDLKTPGVTGVLVSKSENGEVEAVAIWGRDEG